MNQSVSDSSSHLRRSQRELQWRGLGEGQKKYRSPVHRLWAVEGRWCETRDGSTDSPTLAAACSVFSHELQTADINF